MGVAARFPYARLRTVRYSPVADINWNRRAVAAGSVPPRRTPREEIGRRKKLQYSIVCRCFHGDPDSW